VRACACVAGGARARARARGARVQIRNDNEGRRWRARGRARAGYHVSREPHATRGTQSSRRICPPRHDPEVASLGTSHSLSQDAPTESINRESRRVKGPQPLRDEGRGGAPCPRRAPRAGLARHALSLQLCTPRARTQRPKATPAPLVNTHHAPSAATCRPAMGLLPGASHAHAQRGCGQKHVAACCRCVAAEHDVQRLLRRMVENGVPCIACCDEWPEINPLACCGLAAAAVDNHVYRLLL